MMVQVNQCQNSALDSQAFVTSCNLTSPAQVVIIDRLGVNTGASCEVEKVARFYGLSTPKYELVPLADLSCVCDALRQNNTVAAIITSDALSVVDCRQLTRSLQRNGSNAIPILLVAISVDTEPELLLQWTGGAVTGCEGPVNINKESFYRVGAIKDVTRQLSDQSLNTKAGQTYALSVNESKADSVIGLCVDSRELPTFVRTRVESQEVFLSAVATVDNAVTTGDVYDKAEYQFSAAAPLYIFLSYAAGERAWHSNRTYANLTIDDPLLREPYGHLRYAELLYEMQQHNFHTTIAHIPWNFDRTEPEVVALFQANPDRLSVTVHGNNHDHQEFPSLRERSLEVQAVNIKQALARMERFRTLTNLPYDRVMVFPHAIASEATLGLLKKYNYLATANSRNIPPGSDEPRDPQFPLRPTTLAFAGFAAIRRYSAEMPISTAEIAINAFLGNPILLYVHHAYFAEGIGRFNSIADTINCLERKTVWRGLGEIAQHLYLERLREDGNYDIKAFTNELQLDNIHSNDAIFFIEKEEDFMFPLNLSIDGVQHHYSRVGNSIRFEVLVRAGRSRHIAIRYRDNLDLASVDVSRKSLRIAGLRYLSEFRDNMVSRSAIGRTIIRAYTLRRGVVERFLQFCFR